MVDLKYDLGTLVTPCGKRLHVLRHTTAREEDRVTETEEDKMRKSKWKIRVWQRENQGA